MNIVLLTFLFCITYIILIRVLQIVFRLKKDYNLAIWISAILTIFALFSYWANLPLYPIGLIISYYLSNKINGIKWYKSLGLVLIPLILMIIILIPIL